MDNPSSSELRLSDFIRLHLEAILQEWEGFAKTILSARDAPEHILRDHASGILLTIADEIDQFQSAADQSLKAQGRTLRPALETEAERHGASRVSSGFTVDETVSEFRALRASVLRLWSKTRAPDALAAEYQTIRFNEAIDQAIAESLARYALDKDEITRRFDTLLSSSPDLNFILDTSGRFLYLNATLAKLFGRTSEEVAGKMIDEFCPDMSTLMARGIEEVCRLHSPYTGELTCRADPANPVTYRYVLLPVLGLDGVLDSLSGSARNISELKASEDQILRHAYYDSLTGLPNRALFLDRLALEVKHATRTNRKLALLYLDLDEFKAVNDRYGHAEGDLLLLEAGRRIAACVRTSDTVARLGGDEFTVILNDFAQPSHIEIITRDILAALARPFHIHGKELFISCSVGVTICPDDGRVPDELVRNADQAMFVAKKSGRNRYSFFTDSMREQALARLKTIDELRRALVERQLCVYYQPIIDLSDGTIVKAEALLRWRHPDDGVLLPSDFIHLAEETGMIREIGTAVLDDAVSRVRRWSAMLGTPFQISVNKSAVEFMDRPVLDAGDFELELIRAGGALITVEITEGIMLLDSPSLRHKLDAFQHAGVQLAIDDFGIGYSSLAMLKNFKVDFLKIDQTFVKDITLKPDSRIFSEMIVLMAHKLGLKVIAEGVETEEQRQWLMQVGCDYAQGFLFSEAVDAEHFERMLLARSPTHSTA